MSVSVGTIAALAPLATPLPASPKGDHFSPAQWAILLALMDAVVPRIVRAAAVGPETLDYVVSDAEYAGFAQRLEGSESAPDSGTLDAYLAEQPSQSEEFRDLLLRQLVFYAKEEQTQGLKLVLSALR